jgi:hypothetical protein
MVFLGLVRVSIGGAAEEVNQRKGRKKSMRSKVEFVSTEATIRRNASRAILVWGMSLLENSAPLE